MIGESNEEVPKNISFAKITADDIKHELKIIAFQIFIAVGMVWLIVGVHPLRADQMIFLASTIALPILYWVDTEIRAVEILIDVLMFLLSELAVFVTTILGWFYIWKYFVPVYPEDEKLCLIGCLLGMSYGFLPYPATNIVAHSMLVYSMNHRSHEKIARCCAAIKFFYCVFGVILLYGSVTLLFPMQKEMSPLIVLVLIVQSMVAYGVIHTVIELQEGEVGNVMKRWFELSTHSRCIIIVTLLPIFTLMLLIVKVYGMTAIFDAAKSVVLADVATLTRIRRMGEGSMGFEVMRSLSLICCGEFYSSMRHIHVMCMVNWKPKKKPQTKAQAERAPSKPNNSDIPE